MSGTAELVSEAQAVAVMATAAAAVMAATAAMAAMEAEAAVVMVVMAMAAVMAAAAAMELAAPAAKVVWERADSASGNVNDGCPEDGKKDKGCLRTAVVKTPTRWPVLTKAAARKAIVVATDKMATPAIARTAAVVAVTLSLETETAAARTATAATAGKRSALGTRRSLTIVR